MPISFAPHTSFAWPHLIKTKQSMEVIFVLIAKLDPIYFESRICFIFSKKVFSHQFPVVMIIDSIMNFVKRSRQTGDACGMSSAESLF